MSRALAIQPGGIPLTENDVRQIVDQKLEPTNEKLDRVISTMNKIDGGVKTVKVLLAVVGGLLAALVALAKLLFLVKGLGI
jgi:hypothetical protein